MKAPWNDVNLRYAINYAIDRQQSSRHRLRGRPTTPIVLAFSAYMARTG